MSETLGQGETTSQPRCLQGLVQLLYERDQSDLSQNDIELLQSYSEGTVPDTGEVYVCRRAQCDTAMLVSGDSTKTRPKTLAEVGQCNEISPSIMARLVGNLRR